MAGPAVSDHALIRFLELGGELDIEGLRNRLENSLERAQDAASDIGGGDYLVTVGDLSFVVREGEGGAVVTTVVEARGHGSRFHALKRPGATR